MNGSRLHLICPNAAPTDKSEAELFGAMVWLWMHSSTHRLCPLHELQRMLLPALKTGQFVLALQDDPQQQPVGLMTWAFLTPEAEHRYLQTLDRTLQPEDWRQGNRPWILDWVVPFGHTRAVITAVRHLLPQAHWRGLYHRGDETGLRVMQFKGAAVSKAQQAEFWANRPLPQQHIPRVNP